MPRTIERTVYAFSELSDEAKKYARRMHVEGPDYPHYGWWDFNGLVMCAECLGIEIDGGPMGPKHGQPDIYFQLHTQGSGASFTGNYKMRADAIEAIAEHAPLDQTLKELAAKLTALQVKAQLTYGMPLVARVGRYGGRSVHSMSMDVFCSVEDKGISISDGGKLESILRAFADWMYRHIEDQHDYYFEDDVIDEALVDTEFDENGCVA